MCVYIYIERERERLIICVCIYIYTVIYLHICIVTCTNLISRVAASGPTPEIEEIGLQPLAEEMHLSMLRDCRRHEFYDQCLARRISEVRGKVLMPAWLPGQLVERFTISVELVGCSKPAHSPFHCSLAGYARPCLQVSYKHTVDFSKIECV